MLERTKKICAHQMFEMTHALQKQVWCRICTWTQVINKRKLETWAVLQISSRLCNSIISLWLIGHKIHDWNSGFQPPFLLLLLLDCPLSPQQKGNFSDWNPHHGWERKSLLCIFGIISLWWFFLCLGTAAPTQRAVRPAPPLSVRSCLLPPTRRHLHWWPWLDGHRQTADGVTVCTVVGKVLLKTIIDLCSWRQCFCSETF